MTTSIDRRLSALALIAAIAAVIGAGLLAQRSPADSSAETVHYRIAAVGPQFSPEELDADSELVVVGRAGTRASAWNSSDNRPWVPADGDPGDQPLIYTDTQFTVLRVIRGNYEAPVIEVRTVGGVVGAARMTVGATPEVEIGRTYLLLLEYVQAPMRQGYEQAWAPVSLGQGMFLWDDSASVFRNALGEQTAERDLAQ